MRAGWLHRRQFGPRADTLPSRSVTQLLSGALNYPCDGTKKSTRPTSPSAPPSHPRPHRAGALKFEPTPRPACWATLSTLYAEQLAPVTPLPRTNFLLRCSRSAPARRNSLHSLLHQTCAFAQRARCLPLLALQRQRSAACGHLTRPRRDRPGQPPAAARRAVEPHSTGRPTQPRPVPFSCLGSPRLSSRVSSRHAAQHDSLDTSRPNVWAASLRPSLIVRYGANVSVRSFTVR